MSVPVPLSQKVEQDMRIKTRVVLCALTIAIAPALVVGYLRRAAHALKSAAATFDATALSASAKELVYLARDGQLAGAGNLIEATRREFTRASEALTRPGNGERDDAGQGA